MKEKKKLKKPVKKAVEEVVLYEGGGCGCGGVGCFFPNSFCGGPNYPISCS